MNPSDDIFLDCLVQIKADEGFRGHAYVCPAGALTVGYGRNIDTGGPGITEAEAAVLLANDITACDEDCRKLFSGWDTFSRARRAALINLRFQLGSAGLRRFGDMISAIEAGDWKLAAAELMCSLLAKQTRNRTLRRANELERGMIGYRKLAAWLLVFLLCAAVALRAVWVDKACDVPQVAADLLKWATGFFFGFNVADKLTDKYTLTKDGLQDSQPKP